ncbi:nucleotidyltransferase family protein [Streptomyces silvensis]|uniref:Nucleotidyltransferase n=1 Tax=Streptomyces silvensis TaxID=1765722 RepID=A0A0W7X7A5_9ACTN|nr:nucleotidyltransferase family protein [Streptomyces silvensis]KUF18647.1 hypothetical protein AT728_06165 [Streptomyces silvensis]
MTQDRKATPPSADYPDDDVWAVLELVASQQGLDEDPGERADLVRSPDFDHGRLVEHAMRHGLMAALADYLYRHGLYRAMPGWLRNPVLNYRFLSEHRARAFTGEAARVAACMEQAGIRFAWTKGVVLQSTLYDSTFVRTYNDIDMMIDPGDREGTEKALISLDYRPRSTFDPVNKKLRDLSRAKQLIYRMSPDHLPHFHRLTDDACVPTICVDVANSLTWHNSDWQVPMDAVMEEIRPVEVVGGGSLTTLSPSHSLLFLFLHLFREAWIERVFLDGDITLAQLADIARAWRRASIEDRQRVRTDMIEFGLSEPVAWVGGHTDAVFGTDVVHELGLADFAGGDWLASAQGSGGCRLRWSGDMRERLRNPARMKLTPIDTEG